MLNLVHPAARFSSTTPSVAPTAATDSSNAVPYSAPDTIPVQNAPSRRKEDKRAVLESLANEVMGKPFAAGWRHNPLLADFRRYFSPSWEDMNEKSRKRPRPLTLPRSLRPPKSRSTSDESASATASAAPSPALEEFRTVAEQLFHDMTSTHRTTPLSYHSGRNTAAHQRFEFPLTIRGAHAKDRLAKLTTEVQDAATLLQLAVLDLNLTSHQREAKIMTVAALLCRCVCEERADLFEKLYSAFTFSPLCIESRNLYAIVRLLITRGNVVLLKRVWQSVTRIKVCP